MFDTVIIGAGVTGTAVAYYLSSYKLNMLIVDKEEDICSGTSKANSAIIHAGHDAKSGSLKARFNVEGSRMIKELSRKLGFSYRNNGALVLCFSKEDMPKLEELYQRGLNNGVEALEIIDGEKAREMEPNLSKEVYAALYCPTSAIVCPFELTQALCENACRNGSKYRFSYRAEKIEKKDDYYLINDEIKTRSIINCAGVYADEGITGTKDNRPEFIRLLEDCRKGKIDLVITKSITRFARNTVVLLDTIRELKLLEIDVFFEKENMHSISKNGELMLTLLAMYAEEEARSASENQKWRIFQFLS